LRRIGRCFAIGGAAGGAAAGAALHIYNLGAPRLQSVSELSCVFCTGFTPHGKQTAKKRG
jgi:hypothetical protein